MKCPNCGGKGKYKNGFGKIGVCYYCLGTGEVNDKGERVLTEQEYMQTCNTEQLAKVLNTIFLAKTFCQVCSDDCGVGQECKYDCCGKQDDFITWLKQPHTEKE